MNQNEPAERHACEIRRMAREILVATIKLGGKYYALCKYIRENNLTPRMVTTALKAEGLSRHVCSKVNRVANCPDYYWNEYEAREIGFKRVLDMTRNEPLAEFSKQSGLPVETVKGYATLKREARESERAELSEDDMLKQKLEEGLCLIEQWARAKQPKRERKWVLGNGYTIKVIPDRMLPRGNISLSHDNNRLGVL